MIKKAIILESPLDCPWRLEEMGKYGCGDFSTHDYLHARKHPCPCNGEFPDNCPLDKVSLAISEVYQRYKHLDSILSESDASDTPFIKATADMWKAIKADLNGNDNMEVKNE